MPRSFSHAPYEIPKTSSVEAIALDELESPIVRLGVAYWRALRGARRFPARHQMYPRDIAGALRNMVLVKVLDGGADYEYRIVGEAQVKAYSITLQGRRLGEIGAQSPTFAEIVRGIHGHVVRVGEPCAARGHIGRDIPVANFIYSESAFLPLGESDAGVDHLLIFSTYVMHAFPAN